MICDFGDVVVVPFPFVDVAAEKRRPCVVLSRRAFNESHGHSIFVMITAAARSHWGSDIAIDEWESSGLPHSCYIRWKVFTLPNNTILRLCGSLGQRNRDLVVLAARSVLI